MKTRQGELLVHPPISGGGGGLEMAGVYEHLVEKI